MINYKDTIDKLKEKIHEYSRSSVDNDKLSELLVGLGKDPELLHTLLIYHSSFVSELSNVKSSTSRSLRAILDEIYYIYTQIMFIEKNLKTDIANLQAEVNAKCKRSFVEKMIVPIFVILFFVIVIFSLYRIDNTAANGASEFIQKNSNTLMNMVTPK